MYRTYASGASYPRDVLYHPQHMTYRDAEKSGFRPYYYLDSYSYENGTRGYIHPSTFLNTRRKPSFVRGRPPSAPAALIRVPQDTGTPYLVPSPALPRFAPRTGYFWESPDEMGIEPELFRIVRNEQCVSPVEELDEEEFEELDEEELENEENEREEIEVDEEDGCKSHSEKRPWTNHSSESNPPKGVYIPPAFSPPPGSKDPLLGSLNVSASEVMSLQPKVPSASLLRKYRFSFENHQESSPESPPLVTVMSAHSGGPDTESSSHCTINPAVRSAVTRLLAEGPPPIPTTSSSSTRVRLPDIKEHEPGLRISKPKDTEAPPPVRQTSGGGDRVPSPCKPQSGRNATTAPRSTQTPSTSTTKMRSAWTARTAAGIETPGSRSSEGVEGDRCHLSDLMGPALSWELQQRRRGVPRSSSAPTTQRQSRVEVTAESKSVPVFQEGIRPNQQEADASYVEHLHQLRWEYLRHIREEMGRLEEVERFLDDFTRIDPAG